MNQNNHQKVHKILKQLLNCLSLLQYLQKPYQDQRKLLKLQMILKRQKKMCEKSIKNQREIIEAKGVNIVTVEDKVTQTMSVIKTLKWTTEMIDILSSLKENTPMDADQTYRTMIEDAIQSQTTMTIDICKQKSDPHMIEDNKIQAIQIEEMNIRRGDNTKILITETISAQNPSKDSKRNKATLSTEEGIIQIWTGEMRDVSIKKTSTTEGSSISNI